MAQWQEVQGLARAQLERVHRLYTGAALPMSVREGLAAWIEDQNWQQAAEPLSSSHACMLFHSLLALLDERLGGPVASDHDFMLKHNLRKARRELQAEFEECPEKFANLVANLLQEERQILRQSQAGEQRGAPPAPSTTPENSREQQIQRRLGEFHTALKEVERAFRHLEDLQDTFDFCYKLYNQPGQDRTSDPQKNQQLQALQAKLQILDRQRREVLAQLQQLLGRSETLRDFLQQELGAWRQRQQRSCLGAPDDTDLRPLETWFTELGQGLFQLLQLLRALDELRQKVTYEQDPLKAGTPLLEQRLRELLTFLLKSAFVVEQQPCMPNSARRPLVLRTGTKFSARARLLVRLHQRRHHMQASIHIDRDPPNIKGFRRFNILTSSSKTLLTGDSPQEGLICDFQYLTLKEQKESRSGKGSKGTSEVPLAVTEELHLITFTLAYAYCGLELELETSSLPFIIISNNNQLSSAWASILWFNMLSSDPKDQQFFSAPPPAPWPLLAEVLSWQFQRVAERGLSRDHLLMLGEKLFGSKLTPESTVTWPRFSKDSSSGFSFWAWLDGILGLLQEHLKLLWKDGLILGFVSRRQEKKLLKTKQTGTFLLRFSESVLGGVTCTWVEHPSTGPPRFRAVDPYTAAELASLALPDIIRDYQLLAEENVPENPLCFLYPNTPRDVAFGPYYSQRHQGDLAEQKKYLNRRLIRVSSRQANDSWQTEEDLVVATGNLETLQLQPSGQGPGGPGGPALPQPQSSGTLQPEPRCLEPPQLLQEGSGVLEKLQLGVGNMEPQLVLQVVPEGQGVLQVVPEGQGVLQVGPGVLGTLQVLPTGLGMLQVGPKDEGTQQVGPGAVEPQLVVQMIPEGQRVLQVGAEGQGLLQPVAGDVGLLQQGTAGDTELLQPLPPELKDLELLPSSPDVQEFLQSLTQELEPSSGALEVLEPAELVPDLLEAAEGELDPELLGLPSPHPAGSHAALLDSHDPFLPLAEDTAAPQVSSLFATDFPPLQIDASDFQ